MGDGVDETVVLFAPAKLAHQEDRIHHHAGDDQGEKDDAEKQQHTFAPIQDDPSHVQRDCQCNQADAQAQEEDDGSATARDTHGGST